MSEIIRECVTNRDSSWNERVQMSRFVSEWLVQTKVIYGTKNAGLLFGVDEARTEETWTIDNFAKLTKF